MTVQEIDLILMEMAKFHAVSYDYMDKYPTEQFIKDYTGLFCIDGVYSMVPFSEQNDLAIHTSKLTFLG